MEESGKTLADFSKGNFPWDMWFIMDAVYFYPNKYMDSGDLEGVYGLIDEDEIETGIGDIAKSEFADWGEFPKKDIPDQVFDAMMEEFEPLKDEDKEDE